MHVEGANASVGRHAVAADGFGVRRREGGVAGGVRGGVGAASEHRGERDGDEDELGGGGSHGARGGEGRGGRCAAFCAARRTM